MQVLSKSFKVLVAIMLFASFFFTIDNVHFVNKVEASTIHIWNKYEAEGVLSHYRDRSDDSSKYSYLRIETDSEYTPGRYYGYYLGDIDFDSATGVYSIKPNREISWVYINGAWNGSSVYAVAYDDNKKLYRYTVQASSRGPDQLLAFSIKSEPVYNYSKKTSPGYPLKVYSPYSSTYPTSGIHSDGYWYEYVGVNNEPTLKLITTNNQTLNAVG